MSRVYTGPFVQVAATDNAILLKTEGQEDDEAEWVPLSQISKIVRDGSNPRHVTVTMEQWIAQRKGFI